MRLVTVDFMTSPEPLSTQIRVSDLIKYGYGEDLSGDKLTEKIINKAVMKVFGNNCWWWKDSNLGLHYGQVVRKLKAGFGVSCITSCIYVDVK